MKEIWKKIENYDCYYVSNLGRIKSFKNNKEKFLKPSISTSGYLQVILCKNSKTKSYFVHKLVANAFVKNIKKYKEVNHIDENKFNNMYNNLEWCNRKYNMNYGTIKEKISNSKNKKVAKFDKNGILIESYKSIFEASIKNNVGGSNISRCCRHIKNYNTCKGYIWEYI